MRESLLAVDLAMAGLCVVAVLAVTGMTWRFRQVPAVQLRDGSLVLATVAMGLLNGIALGMKRYLAYSQTCSYIQLILAIPGLLSIAAVSYVRIDRLYQLASMKSNTRPSAARSLAPWLASVIIAMASFYLLFPQRAATDSDPVRDLLWPADAFAQSPRCHGGIWIVEVVDHLLALMVFIAQARLAFKISIPSDVVRFARASPHVILAAAVAAPLFLLAGASPVLPLTLHMLAIVVLAVSHVGVLVVRVATGKSRDADRYVRMVQNVLDGQSVATPGASVVDALTSRVMLQAFRTYTKKHLTSEPLDFIIAALRHASEPNERKRRQLGAEMMQIFIVPGCREEINLSDAMRNDIMSATDIGNPEVFAAAMQEMRHLLELHVLPEFTSSPLYHGVLHHLARDEAMVTAAALSRRESRISQVSGASKPATLRVKSSDATALSDVPPEPFWPKHRRESAAMRSLASHRSSATVISNSSRRVSLHVPNAGKSHVSSRRSSLQEFASTLSRGSSGTLSAHSSSTIARLSSRQLISSDNGCRSQGISAMRSASTQHMLGPAQDNAATDAVSDRPLPPLPTSADNDASQVPVVVATDTSRSRLRRMSITSEGVRLAPLTVPPTAITAVPEADHPFCIPVPHWNTAALPEPSTRAPTT